MKKAIILVVTAILLLSTLPSCSCEHDWQEATCTEPKTCTKCGETEGEANGHYWIHATCEKPYTCRTCGEQQGETIDHNWIEATCTYPKKCTVCNKTEGEAKEHDFEPATLESPKTCKNCGHTEGAVLQKLSSSCDKVLASGEDKDGNFFELVANEREDFSGVTIELGIIKNNDWSINLTTKSPFIGEDGLLTKASERRTGSIYDEDSLGFDYVGAGCFYYDGNIWNGNNGKYYLHMENDSHWPKISMTLKNKNRRVIANNDGEILLETYDTFRILYLDTMTTKNIYPDTDGYFSFPLSEGLFALYDSPDKGIGFFDTNGKKVIDLSGYKFNGILTSDGLGGDRTLAQELVFINGKCTFTVINDIETEYKITIDKQGNVISSVEMD